MASTVEEAMADLPTDEETGGAVLKIEQLRSLLIMPVRIDTVYNGQSTHGCSYFSRPIIRKRRVLSV